MLHKLGWALSGALALVAILALARATTAGPLDPPGPVGTTMRTLDQLLPSWGQALTSTGGCASARFTCVMTNQAAVLDHETGLVWQRTPGQTYDTWVFAKGTCELNPFAGRFGWRLPTLPEVISLYDAGTEDGLPAGHPFLATDLGAWWTTTNDAVDDQLVLGFLNFGDGAYETLSRPKYGSDPYSTSGTWCVRGLGGETAESPDEQPAWSRSLSAEGGCSSQRFQCVLNGEAVLDRETGLVWQRVAANNVRFAFDSALLACLESQTGGTGGWRLPKADELASLGEPSAPSAPRLPVGHPFTIQTGVHYWSSTHATSSTAFSLQSDTGVVNIPLFTTGPVPTARAWCVRGSGGDDAY